MGDLICRQSMQRCPHPGMCSPHGGCRPPRDPGVGHVDLGKFIDWVWELKAERDMLKAENARLRPVIEAVASESPNGAYIAPGNAPGHCHTVPGVWDRGNADRAGKECGWCKAWTLAKALVQEQCHDA